MSRRDRQNARRRIHEQRRQHDLACAQEGALDWPVLARQTAGHLRARLGLVPIGDTRPHYLCELGLNDVCKRTSIGQATTRLPDVIRTGGGS